MTPPHICMLIEDAHARHPILRRQVITLLDAGYRLTVLERHHSAARVGDRKYSVQYVPPVGLGGPGRLVWKVLRRILPQSGELWWTFVHVMQVLLGGARCMAAAYVANADYYQAHDLYSLLPAWAAARLRGARLVFDAHELASDQGDTRSLRNKFERVLERWLVPRSDEVIMPSAARGQLYSDRLRLRRPPTIVMNCPPTASVPRSEGLLQRLGLEPSTRIVLYHGAFVPRRALEELMTASVQFDPGIVLVMIGEQNAYFHEVLAPLHAKAQLDGRVFFLGYVHPDDILSYVASADVGVVINKNVNVSNALPAPTKLYEFLMMGIPVVVMDLPEMRHLLKEFPVGVVFDPEEPASIAAAVNATLSAPNHELCQRNEALERARRTFTWERESQKFLRVFA